MIPELDKEALAARIVKNIAALVDETTEPFVLNLGVGIPTEVATYVKNPNIYIQAENDMTVLWPARRKHTLCCVMQAVSPCWKHPDAHTWIPALLLA
jgi:acyl CoA:acetate/3-ketoacid CoA transferase beta subunit